MLTGHAACVKLAVGDSLGEVGTRDGTAGVEAGCRRRADSAVYVKSWIRRRLRHRSPAIS